MPAPYARIGSIIALLALASIGFDALGITYNVTPTGSGTSSVAGAIAAAQPGDTIVLANGTYTMAVKINANSGTSSQPITFKAANRGMAVFSGGALDGRTKFTISRDFWIIDGIKFQNVTASGATSSDTVNVIKLVEADNCVLRHITITGCGLNGTTVNTVAFENSNYILLTGGSSNNVIERCLLTNDLKSVGVTIGGSGTDQDNTDNLFRYNHVDHFDSNNPIQVAWSNTAGVDPYRFVMEHNLLESSKGPHNKSAENTYRYNTFRNSSGQLTLRAGARCVIESNYFFDSRGIGVYGLDHTIHNNYIEGWSAEGADSLDGGLAVHAGSITGNNHSDLFSAVTETTFSNNTLYNTDPHVASVFWGKLYNFTYNGVYNNIAPQSNTISNNVVVNNQAVGWLMNNNCPDLNNTWSNNVVWSTSPGVPGYVRTGLSNANPGMVNDANGWGYRIPSGSHASKGAHMPYRPLTAADVGPGSTYVAGGGGGGGTAILYEAESLTRTFSSGDNAVTHSDVNCSNGQWVLLTASGANDWIEFPVNVATSGTYTVTIKTKKMSSRGQCVLLIDTVQLGGTWDQYSATAAYTSQSFGTRTLSAGTHTFRFKVTGKNASSNDYDLSIDAVLLTP